LEIARLPEDNDMRAKGETEKCIYNWYLKIKNCTKLFWQVPNFLPKTSCMGRWCLNLVSNV
jgi:hypothetical protein